MDNKTKFRNLVKQSGLSLTEVAKVLETPHSTVKKWHAIGCSKVPSHTVWAMKQYVYDTANKNGLAPCPICRRKKVRHGLKEYGNGQFVLHFIQCECGCKMEACSTEEEAKAKWNNRRRR